MDSTRFPGKMMADIAGKPTLRRVIERVRQARNLDGIVLATTTNEADRVLVDTAEAGDVSVYRGSENDVLARVVEAHEMMKSDLIVEVCGDCPLIDPEILDQAVETYRANSCDLVVTGSKQLFPQGTEISVFGAKTLGHVANVASNPEHREHVPLYFFDNAENYRFINMIAPASLQAPYLRLLLDYRRDLELITKIYELLEPELGGSFRITDILALIRQRPELASINSIDSSRSAG